MGIVINAVLFLLIAEVFHDTFYIESFGAAIGASILLSILNVLVKPILIILTLPATILSLGLFLFVINAITLLLIDALMGSAFQIESFGTALFIAVIMSLANVVIQRTILKPNKWK